MSNTDASSASGSVQSVDRALQILEFLARGEDLGVTELAAELGVHKSTAFRLVATLEQHRLVEQVEDRGRYRLGVGLLRLAGATTARLDLVQEARPLCRRLAAETGETVNLAVLADRVALYVDQAAGSSALQSHNWVGQRIPLHATSNGKILLSELPASERARLLDKLAPYTPTTITDARVLSTELDVVAAKGYAKAIDEFEHGLAAVAAPIRNAEGIITASMSVSGPTFRLGPDRLDEVLRLLTATADELSRRLGWDGRSKL